MRYTRGAKAFSVNQSVDHRPRALLVSGFEPDELDAVHAHFAVSAGGGGGGGGGSMRCGDNG